MVLDHIGKAFTTHDTSLMYPYDLEDALLLWMNQCLNFASNYPPLKNRILEGYPKNEFEDLGRDFSSGWMMVIILILYFPESDTGGQLSRINVEENFKVMDSVVKKMGNELWLPWIPSDMKSKNEGRIIGTKCPLFVTFLCSFLKICPDTIAGTLERKNTVPSASKVRIQKKILEEIDISVLVPSRSKVKILEEINRSEVVPKHPKSSRTKVKLRDSIQNETNKEVNSFALPGIELKSNINAEKGVDMIKLPIIEHKHNIVTRSNSKPKILSCIETEVILPPIYLDSKHTLKDKNDDQINTEMLKRTALYSTDPADSAIDLQKPDSTLATNEDNRQGNCDVDQCINQDDNQDVYKLFTDEKISTDDLVMEIEKIVGDCLISERLESSAINCDSIIISAATPDIYLAHKINTFDSSDSESEMIEMRPVFIRRSKTPSKTPSIDSQLSFELYLPESDKKLEEVLHSISTKTTENIIQNSSEEGKDEQAVVHCDYTKTTTNLDEPIQNGSEEGKDEQSVVYCDNTKTTTNLEEPIQNSSEEVKDEEAVVHCSSTKTTENTEEPIQNSSEEGKDEEAVVHYDSTKITTNLEEPIQNSSEEGKDEEATIQINFTENEMNIITPDKLNNEGFTNELDKTTERTSRPSTGFRQYPIPETKEEEELVIESELIQKEMEDNENSKNWNRAQKEQKSITKNSRRIKLKEEGLNQERKLALNKEEVYYIIN
jgi:hypothetical protein